MTPEQLDEIEKLADEWNRTDGSWMRRLRMAVEAFDKVKVLP